MKALIVVDVQNDFCEGGSLAVAGGAAVAAAVSGQARAGGYAAVVGTLDWHIDPGDHFGEPPDFVHSWPVHCLAAGAGAQPHPAVDTSVIETWFRKGEYEAAYSGFQGHTEDGIPLAEWLSGRGITELDVMGVATDHCVRATALDAAAAGFETHVLLNLTAGVSAQTTEAALAELRAAGIELTGEPIVATA